MTNRDTQVVVQDLFRNAEHSVLVAGYELYQAAPVFRTLADRMSEEPRPSLRMFLNVKRPLGDTSTDSELIAAFAHRFRTQHWPRDRPLPEIYFDPRSLAIDTKQRAVLHAKCVVVDGRTAFVSSANFTEAAQERNIEVGVLVRSEVIADRLITFFAALISTGAARRACDRGTRALQGPLCLGWARHRTQKRRRCRGPSLPVQPRSRRLRPNRPCVIVWLNPFRAENGHQDGHQTRGCCDRFSSLAWCPFWCPFFNQTG